MRPVIVTSSGVSKSNPIVLDYIAAPFSVGLAAVVSGSATYTIEQSSDDPYASYATDYNTNGTWFSVATANLVAATTSQQNVLNTPCRAVRINQTAGAGGVTLTAIQGLPL